MIYINKKIQRAISKIKRICITNDATGERLGVSGKHISQILKGEVESIRPSTWEKMEPQLRPFLNQSENITVCETGATYCSRESDIRRLSQWLEDEAPTQTKKAIFEVAKAGGFIAPGNSPSGRMEYPSAARDN